MQENNSRKLRYQTRILISEFNITLENIRKKHITYHVQIYVTIGI